MLPALPPVSSAPDETRMMSRMAVSAGRAVMCLTQCSDLVDPHRMCRFRIDRAVLHQQAGQCFADKWVALHGSGAPVPPWDTPAIESDILEVGPLHVDEAELVNDHWWAAVCVRACVCVSACVHVCVRARACMRARVLIGDQAW